VAATLNEACERIYQTFVTDWASTSEYTFDNENFTPTGHATKFVRLSVRHDRGGQETLGGVGNRKFLRGGSVIIQCFAPLAEGGRKVAGTLATTAQNIFEAKTLSPESIMFTDAVIREIGPDESFYQVNVEIFFSYEQTK
jgi:hypothetical protein